MTWDEIEVLHAKSLCKDPPGTPWMPHIWWHQRDALQKSRAALSALREAGVRFMPEVATEEMVEAANSTYCLLPNLDLETRNATIVYRAMRDAGEIKPEDGK